MRLKHNQFRLDNEPLDWLAHFIQFGDDDDDNVLAVVGGGGCVFGGATRSIIPICAGQNKALETGRRHLSSWLAGWMPESVNRRLNPLSIERATTRCCRQKVGFQRTTNSEWEAIARRQDRLSRQTD